MAHPEVTYNTLANDGTNPFQQNFHRDVEETDTENEEAPQNLMIHVVPETNKTTRWNHLPDLDSFFTRMYSYHQKHGFYVMMLQEVLELCQFIFVIFLIIYLLHCVNYQVLFNNIEGGRNHTKITLADTTFPTAQCVSSFSGSTWIVLLFSLLFWIFRLIKVLYHFVQYYDIKLFFNTALKIDDNELENLTWHEVQKRIRDVQKEQQMCIHKELLTELDIYHRILRFKNYMVAMMNKNLLPSTIRLPLLGDMVCLSRGLRYNVELLLFWGPSSPFENNWHLRDEYKRSAKRIELSNKLSKQIFWVAIANLILSPIVFIWQLMFFFFNYADMIKREPTSLGMRTWSQYGRFYLRHFNELDHELDARLNRAYRPACKYMDSFSSPLMAVIARNIVFMFGGVATIFLLLGIYDEDVFQVEHVLTIISVFGAAVIIARGFIPDENLIWCPEQLLRNVLAHCHYLPSSWRGLAHTSRVRDQFEQFFQLKAMYLLNELFSPFVTPFVLLWKVRPKSLELVDFFRNFTVSVVGVGDVCSFAQMDVRKHGNPDWQIPSDDSKDETVIDGSPICHANNYTQGEHGKTELSLVHFTLTNPQWKMPTEARHFVQGIRRNALNDLNKTRGTFGGIGTGTAMAQSLMSVESMGGEYSSIINSILHTNNLSNSQQIGLSMFNQPTYFNQAVPNVPAVSTPQQPNYQSSHITNDFERMLQQNLTDASTAMPPPPLRGTFLHDISEDEDQQHYQSPKQSASTQHRPQDFGDNNYGISQSHHMEYNAAATWHALAGSLRGVTHREGPAEGSQGGLLHSLCGPLPTSDVAFIPEFTATDMCVSTLYLHELHHRQVQRRGVQLEQIQRHLWQQPQPPAASSRPSTSSSTNNPMMERMPLLGSKKS